MKLVAGQAIGLIGPGGRQLLAVFQNYLQGATHTWAVWLSATEWANAALTGDFLAGC